MEENKIEEEPEKKQDLEKKEESEKKEEPIKKEDVEKNQSLDKNEEPEKKQEENIPPLTTEQQNELYEKILSYMGGPNMDENGEIKDISYTNWVEKNEAIKHLCEAYEVIYSTEDKDILAINNIIKNNYISSTDNKSLRNPSGILENHDFACELKLLKWITEDENHKNNFIAFNNINNKEEVKLNQYNDILPYKYNSVPLEKNSKEININNYINASFITNPLNNKQNIIIATQSPLKDTINSFWKMVYNYKIKLIIMLSDTSKDEENLPKDYLSLEKGNILDVGLSDDFKLKIELIDIEEISPKIAYLKKFKINNEYELKYIQVISWPNKGLPGESGIVNILMEKLFNYFKEQIKEEPPTLIHCYDGVGRTGTLTSIFLIMMCLEELKKMKKAPIMGIFNIVRKLREQRYSIITEEEQYKFIYEFALYWIKKNYPKK